MTRRNHRRHNGLTAIYAVLLLLPLAGFASLAIDVGRVRLARADLQTAADAAARAGASGLPDSVDASYSRAKTYAAANTCLGTPVALAPDTDLDFGTWDPAKRTFKTLLPNGNANDPRRTANAVRVTVYRTADRNGPVPLTITKALDLPSANVLAQATALIAGGPTRFGIVALDAFDATGNNASIDSYDAASESYPGAGGPNANASLVSNGTIDLGNGNIYGDVRAGADSTLKMGPNGRVTGWRYNLDQPLAYPPLATADIPPGALPLPASSPVPAGTYTTTTLSGDLTFAGPAKVYVTGDVTLKGNSVVTADNLPANLQIFVVGNGNVDIGGNSELYAHLYAPQSHLNIHGTSAFYGWLVARTVTVKGTGNVAIHYDESIHDATPYRISLVK